MKTESIQLQTAIQRLLDQEKYDETIRFGKEMLFVPLFQYIAKCAADELKKGGTDFLQKKVIRHLVLTELIVSKKL